MQYNSNIYILIYLVILDMIGASAHTLDILIKEK